MAYSMAHLAAGSLCLLEPSGYARAGSGVTTSVSALGPNYLGKLESAVFADVTERSQDLRVHNSFFVRREPHLRRPGQKLLSFWVWLVVRSRDRATPPTW